MRIIARAEIRMALELNKAQEAGMVATREANLVQNTEPRSAGIGDSPTTLPELGIPSQRASEWRKLARIGADEVDKRIDSALAAWLYSVLNTIPSQHENPPFSLLRLALG